MNPRAAFSKKPRLPTCATAAAQSLKVPPTETMAAPALPEPLFQGINLQMTERIRFEDSTNGSRTLTKLPFATVSREPSDAFEYSPREVLEERSAKALCTSVANWEALDSAAANSVADSEIDKFDSLQRPETAALNYPTLLHNSTCVNFTAAAQGSIDLEVQELDSKDSPRFC